MLAQFSIRPSLQRLHGGRVHARMAELGGVGSRQLRGARGPWRDPVRRAEFLAQLQVGIIEELRRQGVDEAGRAFIEQQLEDIPTTDHLRFETIIALAEHPNQQWPLARSTAAQIDSISDKLTPAYRSNGMKGVRDLVVAKPELLAPLAIPEVEAVTPVSVHGLIESLAVASQEVEIHGVINRLSLVALLATFSRLDVETMQRWDAIEPRSLFAMLLPKHSGGRTRHPMSRLIDFMACCAFGEPDNIADGRVPSVAQIAARILDELGGNEDRLNAWRNGRSFLPLMQALRMWDALHRPAERETPMPPISMIVAASAFQSCLVRYDNNRGAVKAVVCVDELYESWWRYHFNRNDWSQGPAKPMAWPACFDRI